MYNKIRMWLVHLKLSLCVCVHICTGTQIIKSIEKIVMPAVNGYCTIPNECICSSNWGGTNCDVGECISVSCTSLYCLNIWYVCCLSISYSALIKSPQGIRMFVERHHTTIIKLKEKYVCCISTVCTLQGFYLSIHVGGDSVYISTCMSLYLGFLLSFIYSCH